MNPIGVYSITNTISVLIYEFNDALDEVKAGLGNQKPEWYAIVDDYKHGKLGFYMGKLFVPFDEITRC